MAPADHFVHGMPCGLPWTTTEQVQCAQERLATWVASSFRRKLSREDCLDVAAVTIAEIERAARGGVAVHHLDHLLRTAAHRNAIDLVRRFEGEAQTGPRRHVSLERTELELAEPASSDELRSLVDDEARRQDVNALAKALDRLDPALAQALVLRHLDGLPVNTCARTMGMSRTRYERVHTRAMQAVRRELAALARDSSCIVLRDDGNRGDVEPLPREAHLAGCLSCRAYARLAA